MFGKLIIIITISVIALAIFSYWNLGWDQIGQTMNTNGVIWIANRKLTVDIADEPQEQMQGLSGKKNLKENEGMLFIFPAPTKPGFWMKEMKFSIDIIWINSKGSAVQINKNVSPATFPKIFYPPSDIKYVLEISAGWSDKNKIKIGDAIVVF